MTVYRSPRTGRPLHADGPYSLRTEEGDERWPVVSGIPYLRLGSESLAAEALRTLDRGDEAAALTLLLAENDAWWDGPAPDSADLRHLIAERERLSLREAMGLLGWGRVGSYFAHRWSDPTYLAGLALLDAHWTAPRTMFELACGIGHYLRALGGCGVRGIGADVVFAKLWVARHWVAPAAHYVCFDAEAPWPIAPRADLALCADAFYFFRNKEQVAARLSAVAPVLAVAHVHNAARATHSAAAATDLDTLHALFLDARVYADEALTAAAAACAVPETGALADTEAFSLIVGARPPGTVGTRFLPCDGRPVRRNPLIGADGPAWPSERYRDEYGARVTWRGDAALPDSVIMSRRWTEAAARRELVDLPERW